MNKIGRSLLVRCGAIVFLICGLNATDSMAQQGLQNELGNPGCFLSRSGKYIATVSGFGTVVLWETVSQQRLAACKSSLHHPKSRLEPFYDGDGAWAVALSGEKEESAYFFAGGRLYQWHWKMSAEPEPVFEVADHTKAFRRDPLIYNLAVSPDGKFLVFSDNLNIGLLRLGGGKDKLEFSTFQAPDSHARFFHTFLPDSSKLIWRDSEGIKAIDLKGAERKPAEIVRSREFDNVACMALAPRGDMVATSRWSGELEIWNDGFVKKELFQEKLGRGPFLAFSPDGELLATGANDGLISVFRVKTKEKLCSVKGPKEGFSGIGFLPDSVTVYGIGNYPEVRYWRFDGKNQIAEITKKPVR